MTEASIIEFVILGAIVLAFFLFLSYTAGKADKNRLNSIPLVTFFSYGEAEELRQFISANGFGAMVDIQSFGGSGNKYVVRILEKDRDAVAIIIKEYIDNAQEQPDKPDRDNPNLN